MEDEELEQEQKQENNENRKQTFKVAFISSVCTLLLIIFILFMVILGFKKCSKNNGGIASSKSSSSQYVEIYDNQSLDTLFKKIVNQRLLVNGFDADSLKDIYAVSYIDIIQIAFPCLSAFLMNQIRCITIH